MTDIQTVEQPAPSRQAIQAKTASRPRRVTGKLLIGCKAIIWEGKELDEAAKAADLTTRTLRLALDRPHVRMFMKTEREVFRAFVSAQNIHYARKMRNESGNAMASLGAMKFIEGTDDVAQSATARQQLPGFVIVVQAGAILPQNGDARQVNGLRDASARGPLLHQDREIEAKPLERQVDGGQGDGEEP